MAARRPVQRLAAHLTSPCKHFTNRQFNSTRRWLSSSASSQASKTESSSSSRSLPLLFAAAAIGFVAPLAYKMVCIRLGDLISPIASGHD